MRITSLLPPLGVGVAGCINGTRIGFD